jgi:tetratricopeptide (TPR) repeat protein
MSRIVSYVNRQLLQEVEALQLEVLKIYKPLLDNRHPNTLRVMADLANTYVLQCRIQEAEELYTPLIENIKATFGTDHLETIRTSLNLAIMYKSQGRSHEAEVYAVTAFEASKRARGENDSWTISCMFRLLAIWRACGQYDDAIGLVTHFLSLPVQALDDDISEARSLRRFLLLWKLNFQVLRVWEFTIKPLLALDYIFVVIILEVWSRRLSI